MEKRHSLECPHARARAACSPYGTVFELSPTGDGKYKESVVYRFHGGVGIDIVRHGLQPEAELGNVTGLVVGYVQSGTPQSRSQRDGLYS